MDLLFVRFTTDGSFPSLLPRCSIRDVGVLQGNVETVNGIHYVVGNRDESVVGNLVDSNLCSRGSYWWAGTQLDFSAGTWDYSTAEVVASHCSHYNYCNDGGIHQCSQDCAESWVEIVHVMVHVHFGEFSGLCVVETLLEVCPKTEELLDFG